MAVNMNAEKIGEVKDIAYDTSGKMALIINSPQGVEKFYSMDDTVAIKDIVLVDENRVVQGMPRVLNPGTLGVSQGPRTSIPIMDPADPARPTITMKTCPWCKRDNRAQSKFCVHCGRQM